MKCIPELQQEIVADRMVLFLGAGVSRAAGTYLRHQIITQTGLPTWNEFVTKLAKIAKLPTKESMATKELLDTAEEAKKILGNKYKINNHK